MICILFRIIEADPTSVDESVSTSLVSMHIPGEIFAIPARPKSSGAARLAKIETIVSRVGTNAADLRGDSHVSRPFTKSGP